MNERLADIGVNVTGQRAEPGLDRIDALANTSEAKPIDDPLNSASLIFGGLGVLIEHGDRRCEIPKSNMISAQGLERGVGIECLVVGIAVDQGRRLIGQHLT